MGFDKDFMWGVASAAIQIEGAWDEDGKAPSIWDAMCSGHVLHGDDPGTSCDHYHHFREDIEIMKQLGVQAYRFSVSWPRVIPREGEVNEKGVAFYRELTDELIRAGIRPLCTLYHWDLPMWMQEKGGWYAEEISDRFVEYTEVVVGALSDKVEYWMTFNEGTSFLGEGYLHGTHPPYERCEAGSEDEFDRITRLSRNLLLCHARAAEVIRSKAVLEPKIGIATDCTLYIPDSESDEDIERARKKTFGDTVSHYYLNWWMDPIMNGTAHPRLRAVMREGELEKIRTGLDFIGWNCYLANNYNDGPDGRMETYYQGVPRSNSGFPITPDALYWGTRFIFERYQVPVMITENGFANVDFVMDDGCVHDPQRIQYLTWYLRGLKRAADEGYPVKGYMVWSILDNFEWAFGYEKRFGLVYVDYRTQQRTLKDSALWYAEIIRQNGDNI